MEIEFFHSKISGSLEILSEEIKNRKFLRLENSITMEERKSLKLKLVFARQIN